LLFPKKWIYATLGIRSFPPIQLGGNKTEEPRTRWGEGTQYLIAERGRRRGAVYSVCLRNPPQGKKQRLQKGTQGHLKRDKGTYRERIGLTTGGKSQAYKSPLIGRGEGCLDHGREGGRIVLEEKKTLLSAQVIFVSDKRRKDRVGFLHVGESGFLTVRTREGKQECSYAATTHHYPCRKEGEGLPVHKLRGGGRKERGDFSRRFTGRGGGGRLHCPSQRILLGEEIQSQFAK